MLDLTERFRTFCNFGCKTNVSGSLYLHDIYLHVHINFTPVPSSVDCDVFMKTQDI
jgi:hypothetical protein